MFEANINAVNYLDILWEVRQVGKGSSPSLNSKTAFRPLVFRNLMKRGNSTKGVPEEI
jgi:hypothetical protein